MPEHVPATMLAQDYPAAAAAIVATLSAAPSRAMAWETLGQILIGLGRHDAAVGAFEMDPPAGSIANRMQSIPSSHSR